VNCVALARRLSSPASALLGDALGNQGNAEYWYGRAGKPGCRETLEAEWLSIVKKLLG